MIVEAAEGQDVVVWEGPFFVRESRAKAGVRARGRLHKERQMGDQEGGGYVGGDRSRRSSRMEETGILVVVTRRDRCLFFQ